MNVEVIKTYVLTILVFISILLTFAIWNYQPSYDFLYNNQTEDVNEVDLGGVEKTKRDVVAPMSVIFQNNNHYFGFTNPHDQRSFYESMEEWLFDDPQLEATESVPNTNYQVELVFSENLPAEMIRSLFEINEEDDLPDWSFQRLFISVNNTEKTMQAHFLSEDNDEQLTFTINGASVFKDVWALFEGDERLESYVSFSESEQPIYLPESKLKMRGQTFQIKKIMPNLLVNALFTNKDDVTPNFGEQYYTDGQRGMRILAEGNLVEFINPIHLKVHHTDPLELLERSLKNINDHKGWTDDYHLVNINEADDSIKYRMHYNDLPVHNNRNLSVIEQNWRDQELHLYQRPLFSLNHLFPTDTIELASGEEIIYYLKSNDNYKVENIEKVQVGYDLSHSNTSEKNITFRPAWFVKYNGRWDEIRIEDVHEYEKGGS